jgi:hypothetical protein
MFDKINIESVAKSAMYKANVSSKVEVMRQKRKSKEEIGKSVFSSWSGKEILAVNALKEMHDLLVNDVPWFSTTFLGYHYLMTHYDKRPEAVEWIEMMEGVKTVRDLWNYFLGVNSIDVAYVQRLDGYDHTFFLTLLDTPVLRFSYFALNADKRK